MTIEGLYRADGTPIPISVDSVGRVQVITSTSAMSYTRIEDGNGTTLADVATATATQAYTLNGLVVDGLMYVSDGSSFRRMSGTSTGQANVVCYGLNGTARVGVSVDTNGYVRVETPASQALQVRSSTGTPVYAQSPSSAGLTYVATPASAEIGVQQRYSLNSASFTGGYRIAGTGSAVSTNITVGLYRVAAVGNWFYFRVGGVAASLTTVTVPLAEGSAEVYYMGVTKFSSISASTAGALYLTKLS